MRTKWIFGSPKFHKAQAVRECGPETQFNSYLIATCIFRNFQKFISAKLFGISEISCYHLKDDSEYFSKKNQRCPKSTHKLPISPFSKYHKIPKKSNNFTIFTHFFEKFKNANHRQLDSILAHKMNIRFTKISQSPSRPSARAWNTI